MTTKFKTDGAAIKLPVTARCWVLYKSGSTTYKANIPTPKSSADLQLAMLQRKVGMSQVQAVEPA